MLDGPVAVVAWSVELVMLTWLAQRFGDRRAAVFAAVFLVLVVAATLTFAPPIALVYRVDSLHQAAIALFSLILALTAIAWMLRDHPRLGRPLAMATAAVVVYGMSIVLVGLLTPRGSADEYGDVTRDISQTAQLTLSSFLALLGLALLVYAVARRSREARLAGIALFALVAAKVVLFDTASLDSGFRVGAFVLAGAVLLAGAFLLARLEDAPRPADPEPPHEPLDDR